ncbi:MAG: hypothetical protein GF364_01600 [Candidatus Lokiarchaeota archaeon]|nr:hypothetical protein [Candidatus Lokiarchaeota archaeon]
MKKSTNIALAILVSVGIMMVLLFLNTVELIFAFIVMYFIIGIAMEEKWDKKTNRKHLLSLMVLGIGLLLMVVLIPPSARMSEGTFYENRTQRNLIPPAYVFYPGSGNIELPEDENSILYPSKPVCYHLSEREEINTETMHFDISIYFNFEVESVEIVRLFSDTYDWERDAAVIPGPWYSDQSNIASPSETSMEDEQQWKVEFAEDQDWGAISLDAWIALLAGNWVEAFNSIFINYPDQKDELFVFFMFKIIPSDPINPNLDYNIELHIESDKDTSDQHSVTYSYATSGLYIPEGAPYLVITGLVILACYLLIFALGFISRKTAVFTYEIFLVIISIFILVFYIIEVLNDYSTTGFNIPFVPWIIPSWLKQLIYTIVAVVQWIIHVGIIIFAMSYASKYIVGIVQKEQIVELSKKIRDIEEMEEDK